MLVILAITHLLRKKTLIPDTIFRMTVEKYQRIYEISVTTPDTVERVAWMICEIFGKTAQEVDDMSKARFLKYTDRLTADIKTNDRWYNWVHLETDASKITFGQFVETSFWLKSPVLEVIHLVSASLLRKWSGTHYDATNYILEQPIWTVYDQITEYVESLNKLIKSYSGLFGTNEETQSEKPHQFIDRYGWLYSAKQIADYEAIPLDKVYDLPVIQALNDLSYLKAKQAYDKWLSKQ
jgi:hypothetical protein